MYWLSIKDKLPEPYIFVLVYSQMPGTNEPCPITIARWNGEKWETLCNEEENNACAKGDLFWATDSSEITHWMPLPESPDGEWNGFGKDVGANIKLAKERRERGEGAWQNKVNESKEKEKNQFYFQGKYFDKEEDFFAYSKEWRTLPLNEETAERLLENTMKNILLNIFIREVTFTNGEFSQYLNKIFEFSVNQMFEKETE